MDTVRTMATKLVDLELTEVSCVKAGANAGARILLAKTKRDIPAGFKFGKAQVAYDSEMSLTDQIEDVGEAIQMAYGDQNHWVCIKEVFEDAAIFRICGDEMGDDLYRVAYTHDAATDAVTLGNKVPVKVVYQDNPATEKSAKIPNVKGEQMEEEVLKVELTKAREEFAVLLAKQKADLEAAISVEKAAREEAERKSVAAEALAKAEREERRLSEFITVGKSRFKTIPGEDIPKGSLLKALADKLTPEENEGVLKMLDAGSAAMGQMFVPSGGYTTSAGGGGAEKQLEELAKAKQSAKSISFAKAYDEVLNERPDLYAKYREEKQGVN
jgi:hypothetical protein